MVAPMGRIQSPHQCEGDLQMNTSNTSSRLLLRIVLLYVRMDSIRSAKCAKYHLNWALFPYSRLLFPRTTHLSRPLKQRERLLVFLLCRVPKSLHPFNLRKGLRKALAIVVIMVFVWLRIALQS